MVPKEKHAKAGFLLLPRSPSTGVLLSVRGVPPPSLSLGYSQALVTGYYLFAAPPFTSKAPLPRLNWE